MASNTTSIGSFVQHSLYNYNPAFYLGITFLSLFSLSTILHAIQAIYHRLWYFWPTVILGGIGEIIGWSARVWSSKEPLNQTPFFIQVTTIIVSPTFILAANFVVVGRLITRLGPQYSRLSPHSYMLIFCSCDILALIVQAFGGGLASISYKHKDLQGITMGGEIMLAGICFQLVAITFYTALTAEFVLRVRYKRPVEKSQDHTPMAVRPLITIKYNKDELMVTGITLCTVCMFIRAVYRTVELAGGWYGKIISTQRYFVVLDGGMIALAMLALNIFNPGALLREAEETSQDDKLIFVV